MSRKFIFILMSFVVLLYFAIIMFMLNPLHTAKGQFSDLNNLRLSHISAVKWCKPLQWQVPPSPYRVALASAPGSGNTWLRYLLQQVTGMITGAIYMDQGLLHHGFPGENVFNGSVLVIKTHEPPANHEEYHSAILLIRNPRDSLLADYNRRLKGHIGTAPKSAFKTTKHSILWEKYVLMEISKWESFYLQWLSNFHGPIHIVLYESLVRDTRKELQDILNFLRFNVTEEDMNCAMFNKEGIYRRKRKHKNFDPYTPELQLTVENIKKKVFRMIDEFKKNGTLERRKVHYIS